MTLSAKSASNNIEFQVFMVEDVSEKVCHRKARLKHPIGLIFTVGSVSLRYQQIFR